MHIAHAAFLVTISCSPCFVLAESAAAQSPETKPAAAGQAQAAAAAPPAAAPAPAAPSGMLQPSIDSLQATVGELKLDKWKGGSVRAEATANVTSIQRDLEATLPGLLKDADAAPNSLSSLLPVYRNVDALYDVVLRVYEAARVSGPADQVALLQQSMSSLEGGRRTLNDRLLSLATAQEKQVVQLQTSLQAKPPAPVCPVVEPTPPPAPAKKPVRKKKPATTTQQPAKTPATGTTTTKPNTPQ